MSASRSFPRRSHEALEPARTGAASTSPASSSSTGRSPGRSWSSLSPRGSLGTRGCRSARTRTSRCGSRWRSAPGRASPRIGWRSSSPGRWSRPPLATPRSRRSRSTTRDGVSVVQVHLHDSVADTVEQFADIGQRVTHISDLPPGRRTRDLGQRLRRHRDAHAHRRQPEGRGHRAPHPGPRPAGGDLAGAGVAPPGPRVATLFCFPSTVATSVVERPISLFAAQAIRDGFAHCGRAGLGRRLHRARPRDRSHRRAAPGVHRHVPPRAAGEPGPPPGRLGAGDGPGSRPDARPTGRGRGRPLQLPRARRLHATRWSACSRASPSSPRCRAAASWTSASSSTTTRSGSPPPGSSPRGSSPRSGAGTSPCPAASSTWSTATSSSIPTSGTRASGRWRA